MVSQNRKKSVSLEDKKNLCSFHLQDEAEFTWIHAEKVTSKGVFMLFPESEKM
jgi:hypothetical protein